LRLDVAKTDIVACQQAALPPDWAEPDPAYRAALDWVWAFSAAARSEAAMAAQRARKLPRMRALVAALDDPQRTFRSVLVAGTKGKGSTVAMLDACLRAAGLRTGRYTSPHLVNWRERTCVDGQPISTDAVVELIEPVREAIARMPDDLGQPTTFEVGTAIAFLHFARAHLDVGILEVGVGGRYDATNVVEPLVSVIAPVSYDHTRTLGPTLTQIARHKAGILRSGRSGVIAPQPAEALLVIQDEADAIGASLEHIGRDWAWSTSGDARAPITITSARYTGVPPLEARVALLGDHQRDNATTAVAALHALGRLRPELAAAPDALRAGLQTVEWPGRLQVLRDRPLLVLDGAQNAASAQVLRRALHASFRYARLLVVLGLTEGKDAEGVLEALGPTAAGVFVTRAKHERAAEPSQLAERARELLPGARVRVEPDLDAALSAALGEARPDDLVLVTGSLFLVGEALVWWDRSPR
jgi:dihydrofolate synthase/folylpolyglutamate synthase